MLHRWVKRKKLVDFCSYQLMSVLNHFVCTLPAPALPNKQYYASVEKLLVDARVLEKTEEKQKMIKNSQVRLLRILSRQAAWFERDKH